MKEKRTKKYLLLGLIQLVVLAVYTAGVYFGLKVEAVVLEPLFYLVPFGAMLIVADVVCMIFVLKSKAKRTEGVKAAPEAVNTASAPAAPVGDSALQQGAAKNERQGYAAAPQNTSFTQNYNAQTPQNASYQQNYTAQTQQSANYQQNYNAQAQQSANYQQNYNAQAQQSANYQQGAANTYNGQNNVQTSAKDRSQVLFSGNMKPSETEGNSKLIFSENIKNEEAAGNSDSASAETGEVR